MSAALDQMAAEFERFDADPANAGKIWTPPSQVSALTDGNNLGSHYRSVDDAFPVVRPGIRPFGDRVQVQIRAPLTVSRGGITIYSEVRRTEEDNTQVGKVVALGPTCFKWQRGGKNGEGGTLDEAGWPEGPWCKVGDYVRVPKYTGDRIARLYDRIEVSTDERGREHKMTVTDRVVFAHFKHTELLGVYETEEDALTERAFL